MEKEPHLSEQEAQGIVSEIESAINEACQNGKYVHLCSRVNADDGMTWAVNRCIQMMSKDRVKLSFALATLESELQGID